MQVTNSKLNDYILYSNKNMEKLCGKIISESANAVLLEMFEDKMLMADHISGGIYLADYNFDVKSSSLTLENFEEVEISQDEPLLKNAIRNYFEEDGYDVASIVEAYETEADSNINNELAESITEALASKNVKNVADYTQLIGINEEIEELKTMPFFGVYTEHLKEAPTSSIKFIDWVNPVKVSLISEDVNKVLTFSSKDKAKKLSKSMDFRAKFGKALSDLNEGSESEITDLISENYSILSLDNSDMQELIAMSVVSNKELMENRKELAEKLDTLISEDEILNNYREVLSEDETEDASEEDKKLEVSDKENDALINALDKALEKITDEKLVKKIEDLKAELEASKSEGTTDVEAVKESVELLSF